MQFDQRWETVRRMVSHSVSEEIKAASDYRRRAGQCRAFANTYHQKGQFTKATLALEAANLFDHIADEEDGHKVEFEAMLTKLMGESKFV